VYFLAIFRQIPLLYHGNCTDKQCDILHQNVLSAFDASFFSQLYKQYGSYSIDQTYMTPRLQSLVLGVEEFFAQHSHLPRRVLDIGCGNTQRDFDQTLSDEFAPWLCRTYAAVSRLSSTQSRYAPFCLERLVGLDKGANNSVDFPYFEQYSVDVFSNDLSKVFTGTFGVGVASLFFSSPRLSKERFGDFRMDTVPTKECTDLMTQLSVAIDSYLIERCEGVILYTL
jgi:hypothetical protein